MASVADEWAGVKPGTVQYTETRRAFYAGCQSLRSLLLALAELPKGGAEAGLVRLDAELVAFNKRVAEGMA